ncbi:MAG: hypothetical protein K2Y21_08920 [Phycisphaerales bacterium]|nr:hypothetical protein [Phycisphaerales bacterium]
MFSKILTATMTAAGLAASCGASQIGISAIGGGLVLNSGPLSTMAFGNGPNQWLGSSLAAVHASINASGVNTNGKITFVAAETSAGLAFMTLIDQELIAGTTAGGNVHMDSVADGVNQAFIKDTAGNVVISANGPNARIASGNFAWNSNGGGDGFAWANLASGNTTTFRFNMIANLALGLNASSPFQFVTWDGAKWAEVVVPAALLSFSSTDDFGFSATVLVPSPGVLFVGGISMIGLAARRRRLA